MNNTMRILVSAPALLFLAACSRQEAKSVPVTPGKDAGGLIATPEQMKFLKTQQAVFETIPDAEQATGTVAFNEDSLTAVYSPYAGRVISLLARPGDTIAAGAALLIIETPDVVDAEKDFLAARNSLTKSQVTLKQAERTRNRLQQLVAGEAAAVKDLEQASTDAENAKNDVQAAEAQLESARQRLLNFGKTAEEIEQLALTRRADRTARVIAPIGGQIVARKVGPGQYVRPDNPEPLFIISDTSTMWLLAQVYESQISTVRAGERAQVTVLAFPGQTFSARVSYIAPSVDPATRRVAVRCVIENRDRRLKPEMFATFRLERPPRRVLLVPQSALVREGNIDVLWVVQAGNRISRRLVEAGAGYDGKVEIRSGLREGELVVSDGALFLSSFIRS
jgi:cobalt-zinc-cadmium efflux system membrane fusion protein